ncbi:MAG: InlB B-repeat-containing protein, partial [Clostridia bacterium]
MKLKKILFQIFIGATLLMASLVGAQSIKDKEKLKPVNVNEVSTNADLKYESHIVTTASGDANLFEITLYDNLQYTGSEQTIIEITPIMGTVYYKVELGEYDASKVITESDYGNCLSSEANKTIAIKQTNAGVYTVYYYVPADTAAGYGAVSSSSTSTIENVNVSLTINPDGLTYNGSTDTVTVSQEVGGAYALTNPTNSPIGYAFDKWNGGHTIIEAIMLKNDAEKYDGNERYAMPFLQFTDKAFISFEACMDDWSQLYSYNNSSRMFRIEGGAWNWTTKDSMLAFEAFVEGKSQEVITTIDLDNLSSGWHIFTASYDGNFFRMYVDGELCGSSTSFNGTLLDYGNSANSNSYIGMLRGFHGKIRNFYMANTYVSADSLNFERPTDEVGYSTIHITNQTTDATVVAGTRNANYIIKFDGKGAVGTMANQTFTYNAPRALSTSAFIAPDGYKFAGWSLSDYGEITEGSSDDVDFVNGATINNEIVQNQNWVDGQEITLYAVWVSSYYTANIYLQPTTGSGYESNPSSYKHLDIPANSQITIADEVLKLDIEQGFVLDKVTDSNGVEITETTITLQSGNSVLNYYFKRATYTLTLDYNNGSNYVYNDANTNVTIPSSHTNRVTWTLRYGRILKGLLPIKPTSRGYVFNGWTLEKDSGELISSNMTMPANNLTIYGSWTANKYTVSFDVNGGDNNIASKSATFGQPYGTLPKPSRAGYEFDGWYGDTLVKNWTLGSLAWADSSEVNNRTDRLRSNYIDVEPNTAYKLSQHTNNNLSIHTVYEYDANKEYIKYTQIAGATAQFTTLPETKSIRIVLNPVSSGTDLTNYADKGTYAGLTIYKLTGSMQATNEDTIVDFDGNHTLTAKWSAVPPTIKSITADIDTIMYNSDNAMLNIEVEHDLDVTYQWYRGTTSDFECNGATILANATNNTYTHYSTETSVGEYYYKCIVTSTNGEESESEAVKITVARGNNLITQSCNNNLEYSGYEQILAVISDINNEDEIYHILSTKDNPAQPLNADNYDDIGLTGEIKTTDAGVYTIYFYVPQTDNYNEVSGTITVEIAKRANLANVTLLSSIDYDGQEHELISVENGNTETSEIYYNFGINTVQNPVIELNGDNYDDIGSLVIPKATDAGVYTIYYYIPSTKNYNEVYGSAIVTIRRVANPSFMEPINREYDGTGQALVATTWEDVDGGTPWYSIGTELNEDNYMSVGSTSVPTATEDGTYVVYMYIPETINYYELAQSVEVIISPKVTTLTINPNN